MDYAFENYIKVFEVLGYRRCSGSFPRAGFDKVAIYQCHDGSFGHLARQADGGTWSSKLGPCEDIEHPTLTSVNCDCYGLATIYSNVEYQYAEN